MKAEDVPDEWISVARQAWFHATGPSVSYDWRATIAAVAPLIAAAEREACAKVALYYPTPVDAGPHEAHGRDSSAVGIAAAIRTRSDAP